jgi:putative MFS transporter
MSEPAPALTPYQRRLFVFLSVATFFEGYDFLALTQILPNLRAEFGLEKAWAGYLIAFINLGTLSAFLVVRLADRLGRRRLLTLTIAGYTVLTFLTGFAPNVYLFALLQLGARVFLIGEWAVSMVIAAEEFPAARRGMVIGVIQACSSLGSIVCAGVVPFLLTTPYRWRTVYFVGIVPLVILAYARRGLRETERFAQMKAPAADFLRIWRTPYRARVLKLALIWFVSYVAAQNAIAFWKEFAVGERGFTDADVGRAITIAALASMPLIFAAGKLLDLVGRRPGATIIFALGALGVWGSYTLEGRLPLTVALVLGIFGASAFLPLLNAYNAELFPTELRGDAFAWANNILGRVGYVASPIVVGLIAERLHAFGPVVATTAIFPLVAIVLVWLLLPETNRRELEDTAQVH